MLNRLNHVWGKALACIGGCAAIAIMASPPAGANAPKRIVRGATPDMARFAEIASGQHQSIIRVDDHGGPVRRQLKVGLGKSVLLEFSRELRDVMVSNPEAVDVVMLSSNRVFCSPKKLGDSNAFFFDANGEQFAAFELEVSRDTTSLTSLLQRLIPSSKIVVEMMNETVILTGSVKSPSDSQHGDPDRQEFRLGRPKIHFLAAGVERRRGEIGPDEPNEKVINMLAVEGEEQVMLRVTVAEVQRSALKQLGVNVGGSFSIGNLSMAALTQNALPLTAAQGLGKIANVGVDTAKAAGADCAVVGTLLRDTTIGFSGAAGGWGTGKNCLPFAIQALERIGLVKTLAEPNLTAVSGESCRFLAGGEYPIPMVDNLARSAWSTRSSVCRVAFTPVVMSEGRISLKIEAEVSELTSEGAVLSGIQLPALKKRLANSTVELPSGGSLAMSGLFSEDTRQNIDGLPGLKDFPSSAPCSAAATSSSRKPSSSSSSRPTWCVRRARRRSPVHRRPWRSHGHEGQVPRSHQSHLRRGTSLRSAI